jgi:histone-lysine N-methyltransferase SETMAR
VQKSAENVLASIFWGSRRLPPHSLSSKWPNYPHSVLLISAGATEGRLKEKRRGKVTKGVLFLHDNAPARRALATQKKLVFLGYQCLYHPTYSPDLALSDYHLFLGLKKKN